MANKGNKFIKGAAVLAGAGIMIKVLGAVFRIPLRSLSITRQLRMMPK